MSNVYPRISKILLRKVPHHRHDNGVRWIWRFAHTKPAPWRRFSVDGAELYRVFWRFHWVTHWSPPNPWSCLDYHRREIARLREELQLNS